MFSISNLLVFLVALAHTSGLFSEPKDQEGIDLVSSMRDYRIDLGMGMVPSVHDIQMSLGFTMTVFMVFLGVVNFAMLGKISRRALKRLTLVNALCMWVLAILYLYYRIPPPLMSFIALGGFFTVTFFTMKVAEETS